CQQHYGYPFTF
nr:immunoglobulin light chain junction region [Macaca mulatta]